MTRLVEWDGLRQSTDDISRKFRRAYVRAIVPTVSQDPAIYYLGDFTESQVDVGLIDTPKPGETNLDLKWTSCRWRDVDVLATFPETGVHQVGYTVGILRRNPARQWQVGLGSANAVYREYTPGNARNVLPTLPRLNLVSAWYLYNSSAEGLSVEQGMNELTKNKNLKAVALNRVYWLARIGENTALYRNRINLGTFLLGSLFLQKSCEDLSQELMDDLHIRVRNS